MHYATKCIIASSECATLKDLILAGHVITITYGESALGSFVLSICMEAEKDNFRTGDPQ